MARTAHKKFVVSSLAVGWAILGFAGSAYANELSTEADNFETDDIIVTAQKRAQNVQDVPATINALTAEMIEQRGIGGLEDLQGSVAGLKFDPVAGNSNITIRGVGTTFTTGAGENSVSMHLDGVYISSPQAASLGQFDLGGIEVLRGPQGTLYGKNSTAGIINFISTAPSKTLTAGASASYGNYDAYKLSAYVSGPLADNVSARVYFEGGEHDGYVKNLQLNSRLDDLSYYGGRIAIDAEPTSNWTSELRLTYRHEASAGPVRQPYDLNRLSLPIQDTIVTPRVLRSPLPFDGDRDIALGSWKNTFAVGDDLTLVSITGASKLRVNYNLIDSITQGNPVDPFFPNLTIPISVKVRVDTVSQEFNLKRDGAGYNWIAGVFYYNEQNAMQGSVTLFPALLGGPPGLTRRSDGKAVRESASAFADATINLSDSTRLFAGVRGLYERATNDLLVTFEIIDGPVISTDCSPNVPRQRVTDWSATGRLGVQHDFSSDVMAYGQVSRGYKSGGFSNSTCRNQYNPETVNAGEIGLKSRFLGRRGTLNLSAYYYDYKNMSVEQSTIFGTFVVGAPKSELYGLDVDGRIAVNDFLSFDGNVSFLHGRYKRFLSSGGAIFGDPDGTSLAGRALNKAPGVSGTIAAELEFPIKSGKLTLRGEAYFTSHYRLREYNDPSLIQKGYQLYNAYATYQVNDMLTLRAFGRNLSKTNYIQGTVVQLNGTTGTFNPPRTYGMEVNVAFR